MTGNKNAWRAPLAGLASLAMIATMGVAASTANAAVTDYAVKIYGGTDNKSVVDTFDVKQGASLADGIAEYVNKLSDGNPTNDLQGLTGLKADFTGFTVKGGDGSLYDPTVPVTGDLELEQVTAATPINVTVSYKDADRFVAPVGATVASDRKSYTFTIDRGQNIAKAQLGLDAADGYVVKDWNVTLNGSGQSFADNVDPTTVKLGNPSSVAITEGDADATATKLNFHFDSYASEGTVLGAASDGDKYPVNYTVDVAQGETVKAPEFSVFEDANGKVPTKWTNAKDSNDVKAAGDSVAAVSGVTYIDYQATVDNSVVPVKFVDKNGKELLKTSVTLDKKDTSNNTSLYGFFDAAKVPAAPTVDGYTFLGWKSSVDGKYVSSEASDKNETWNTYKLTEGNSYTFTATYVVSSAVNVTFRDTNDYAGSHADVKTTVNAGGFINTADVPDWTRDGYTLSWHLKADGSDAAINFNTYLVNEKANDFVIYAHWEKATVDKAVKALNYVKVKDFSDKFVNDKNVDYSKFFTDASWTAFKAEYKKAYQTYRTYVYGAANNSVTASKSAEVVNTLQDAWKGLRFSAEYADTVLDGKNNNSENTAKVIYRMAKGSAQHLLTGDEVEVKALTKTTSNAAGWTLDATTFRTVSNVDAEKGTLIHAEWVENEKANTDLGFEPLLKQVSRLYNGREHMYTSDQVEIDALVSSGKWTKDSNLASFYVPAQYTTSTRIVRLYNKATGAHLFTSDKVEINYLTTQKGWVQESDLAGFYAL
ncbi:hypothetical protein COO72_12120 [Bifidobacterium callitrichos]|nr:hypothetical protein COO72_12120 [Bifidobacterium callitrichos]